MVRRKKAVSSIAVLVALMALFVAACAPAGSPSQPAPAAPSEPAAAAPSQPAPAAAPQGEAPAAQFDAAAHFQGKRVTILVSSAAGGGPDTNARLLAPLLSKHLPGNPAVIVENEPGGGGVVAGNKVFHTVAPDGYTLLFASPTLQVSQLFRDLSGATYDMSQMPPLIGFSEAVITYGSAARIKAPADVYRAQEPLFAVARGATSFATIEILSSLDILESKFRAVTYPGGTPEARPAVLRGEADIIQEQPVTVFTTLQPEVEKGTVNLLWQTGLLIDGKVVRDPRAGDVPTFNEFYEQVAGRPLSAAQQDERKIMAGFSSLTRFISTPPNTAAEIRAVLAEALMKAATDPDFVERFALNGVPVTVITEQDASAASAAIVTMPPELVAKHNERWALGQ